MTRLAQVALFLLSSTWMFAQDAHPALKDFLSLIEKWKHARLDVTYMEIVVQHPAVQAVLFSESAATAAELKGIAAEKAIDVDYFRLISWEQQYARAALRTGLSESHQTVKSAISDANNGQEYRSWTYSTKEIKDLFSPLPTAKSKHTRTKSESGIPILDRDRPWAAVAAQMHEALGDLNAVDPAKLDWKMRDGNALTCNTDRKDAHYELTVARLFNAWVPVELVGLLDNGKKKRRFRATLSYQPVTLDGSQLPYPKQISITKELNCDGTYLPYIAFRKVCENVAPISNEEMSAWMTLETPLLIAPDAISRLSKQNESLLSEVGR